MPLLAVLCTLLWGSAFPFVKLGYAAFGIGGDASVYTKLLFAGLRFGFAGVAVLAVGSAAARRPLFFKKSEAGPILLMALVQTVLQYIFFYVGLSNTSGTLGSICLLYTSGWRTPRYGCQRRLRPGRGGAR